MSEARRTHREALATAEYRRRTFRGRRAAQTYERETIAEWEARTGKRITEVATVTPEQAVAPATAASKEKHPIGAARTSVKFPNSPKNTRRKA